MAACGKPAWQEAHDEHMELNGECPWCGSPALRNPVTQLNGVVRESTRDEAHTEALLENRARFLTLVNEWLIYDRMPHGITTDFSAYRPAGARPTIAEEI